MSDPDDTPMRRRRRPWMWLAATVVIAVVAAIVWWRDTPDRSHSAQSRQSPAVQVTVADVTRRDVPVYISGLGTVQASNTVSIHAQVDGTLQEVPFTEGQQVRKGDVLARIDPRLFQAALDQAKAKKAQDEAQLVAAQKDLVRFSTLGNKGFETQQNIDRQQATVDQLKASIQGDAAAIESAQTQLGYTTIVASSDGRMGVRLVDPGNIVHAADQTAIATLTQTRPTAVIFTLPARSLDDVRGAMKRGAVEVTAFDQDNRNALATGQLLLIDNVIDQTTATIRLKAMFPNEDETLWPGEFVNARLPLETRTQALTIPSSAVQHGPDGVFAWVVTDANTAEMRPLHAGPVSGDRTVIEAGLAEGDRVVTDGQYRLQQHAPVAVSAPRPPATGNAS
jgi:membrane fusion protein, multidrug efflux system